ncbi:hypothetical protein NE237_025003 [Protea cynaroides]|uniref:Uncharacterized protein n=1 Tax=Protea cynaroides TaxID=273540 RepID=A0A9Q0H144_9MAGN|nr:hypothetical protein NE237_025003 [Protea cynaroides]
MVGGPSERTALVVVTDKRREENNLSDVLRKSKEDADASPGLPFDNIWMDLNAEFSNSSVTLSNEESRMLARAHSGVPVRTRDLLDHLFVNNSHPLKIFQEALDELRAKKKRELELKGKVGVETPAVPPEPSNEPLKKRSKKKHQKDSSEKFLVDAALPFAQLLTRAPRRTDFSTHSAPTIEPCHVISSGPSLVVGTSSASEATPAKGGSQKVHLIILMGPTPWERKGYDLPFLLDWEIVTNDIDLGDLQVSQELLSGCHLPRNRAMLRKMTTPTFGSSFDTLVVVVLI